MDPRYNEIVVIHNGLIVIHIEKKIIKYCGSFYDSGERVFKLAYTFGIGYNNYSSNKNYHTFRAKYNLSLYLKLMPLDRNFLILKELQKQLKSKVGKYITKIIINYCK